MKNQNKAAAEIINALDALGFNTDKIEFRISGSPEDNPYVTAEIRISRQGFPPADDRSK